MHPSPPSRRPPLLPPPPSAQTASEPPTSSPPSLSQRIRRPSGSFLLGPPRNRRHVPSAIRLRVAFRHASRLFRLFGPLCFFALTFLSFHALSLALQRSPFFRIRAIQCPDHPSLPRSFVLSLLAVKPGDSLLSLDLKHAALRLKNQPQIRAFQIRRQWPDRLALSIEIHDPAAILFLDHPYLVDPKGRIFARALPHTSFQGLLHLRGLQRSDLEIQPSLWQPLLQQALSLAKAYHSKGLSSFLPLREIHIDPLLGYTLLGTEGERILLGPTDLPLRLARLDQIFQHLAKQKSKKISYIYLHHSRNPQRVFLKLADSSPARQDHGPTPQK